MSKSTILNVREIEIRDIEILTDYWLKSDDDFMISMGVDLSKRPSREDFTSMLHQQIDAPLEQKMSYALIWELNEKPIGHSNVNEIEFRKQATMHLHLWHSRIRD